MSGWDATGLAGTALILVTYAVTVAGRIDARSVPALLGNLAGAALILVSLSHDFNLSAVVMESAWAAIAAIGLIRTLLRR